MLWGLEKPTLSCFVGVMVVTCCHSLIDNLAVSFKFWNAYAFARSSPLLGLDHARRVSHLLLRHRLPQNVAAGDNKYCLTQFLSLGIRGSIAVWFWFGVCHEVPSNCWQPLQGSPRAGGCFSSSLSWLMEASVPHPVGSRQAAWVSSSHGCRLPHRM